MEIGAGHNKTCKDYIDDMPKDNPVTFKATYSWKVSENNKLSNYYIIFISILQIIIHCLNLHEIVST